MIVTQVLGNIHDPVGAALVRRAHVERVALASADLVKRIQRLTTDHRTEIGLRLPSAAPALRDGDILHCADGKAIVVVTTSTDVLVIAPRTLVEMGFVAHSLGNRHLPAQFEEPNRMLVAYDHTVVDFLAHHGVPYAREERVLDEPFRHAEHTH